MSPPATDPAVNTATAANPLLDLSGLPRFAEIRPEHVEPAVDHALAEARAAVELIAARSAEATWENFAAPLEDVEDRLSRVWAPVTHLSGVKDSAELREVYERCLPKLSDFHTETAQDERLYRGWQRLAGLDGLDDARRRVVTNAVRDFRLAGVDLPAQQKERYRAIQQELSTLANRFEHNVLDATQEWQLALAGEEEIAGLPVSALDSAREEARRRGVDGWVFTLHGPSYLPFMAFAERRDLRRSMYEAFVTRASDRGPHDPKFDNSAVMVRILQLRHEAATLLGFEDYPAYALSTRMAKSRQEVLDFLSDLATRARPGAEADLADLSALARELDGIDDLQAWDVAYYSEKLRQRRFDYSGEDARPYFALPAVLGGMFEIAARLFGVQIRERSDVQTWHPDVLCFEVYDENGETRGTFFVDACAREGKRSGAWMDDCVVRRVAGGEVQKPVAFLVAY